MTEHEEQPPDVEAIIAEIRGHLEGGGEDEASDRGPWDAPLREAGRLHHVGEVRERGLRGLVRRLAHRALGSLIREINAYHEQELRVLGALARDAETRARDADALRARVAQLETPGRSQPPPSGAEPPADPGP